MALRYRSVVLHVPPLSVETVTAAGLKPTDGPVRTINDGFSALGQNHSRRHYAID